MNSRGFGTAAFTLALLIGLAACGGNQVAEGGIGGTGITQGPVTGFGSVFVNGVEFSLDSGAKITMDGDGQTPWTEQDLAVGMVVKVTGTVASDGRTGMATQIDYADELEGLVQAKNLAADGTGTLTVMGQTVQVDGNTVFDNGGLAYATPDLIPLGAVVEVSGYSAGNGTAYATRIEIKTESWVAGQEMEIKGIVQNPTATTFELGGLTVSHGGAFSVSAGQYVKVKSTQGIVGGQLIASEIELEGEGGQKVPGLEGQQVTLEGYVTSVESDTRFQVNGQTVGISGATLVEGSGVIGVGTALSVTGIVKDGVLEVERMVFHTQADVEFLAPVDAVGSDGATLEMLGRTIRVDSRTVLEHDSIGRDFMSEVVAPGDYLAVYAYEQDGELVATRVKQEDVPDIPGHVELEGPITATTAGSVTVAGVPVTGALLPPGAAVGTQVEVSGAWDGAVITADSISLK